MNLRVVSPMSRGNGACLVHRALERRLEGYRVRSYDPRWQFFPFLLPAAVSTNGADLVHTTPDYGIFLHRSPARLVLTFHNYVLDPWMAAYSSPHQRIHYRTSLRLWISLALGRADAITAVSRFTASMVHKDFEGRLPVPVKVIHAAIDEKLFRPFRARPRRKDAIRVLFSGNLTKRKGAQWLHAIAERLPPHIRIFYTSGLRTRGHLPPHPNLHPMGPIPYEDMPRRYCEMDMLLMPTVREGFSLAVIEAMACGLPVVATDCSSLPEQVDEGRGGFLCPTGDVEAFADRIRTLADSPSMRREMGGHNRAKAEQHFTLERMASRYEELFESVS